MKSKILSNSLLFLFYFVCVQLVMLVLHLLDEGGQGFTGILSYPSVMEKLVFGFGITTLMLVFYHSFYRKEERKSRVLVSLFLGMPVSFVSFFALAMIISLVVTEVF